jgi:hypothetical protein
MIELIDENLPSYTTTLPFSKQVVTFTPFKVKDAKNISIILQENDKKLALIALVNTIKGCCKNLQINDLCLADAEYLFLQIRSKSIEEMMNLVFENKKKQININDIKAKNSILSEEIIVGSNIRVVLETPKIKDLIELSSLTKSELINSSIKKIIVKNEIYDKNKFLPEEIKKTIDNLPISFAMKAEQFLQVQPELYIEIDFDGTKKEVNGILNFFTYR